MKTAQELKKWLEGFDLLHGVDTSEEAVDTLLDSRDSSAFETDYLRILNLVPDEEELGLDDEALALNNAITRLAFKKTIGLGSSELASYVADDFDLLARSLQAKVSDPWLHLFFEQYKLGRFPCGKLL